MYMHTFVCISIIFGKHKIIWFPLSSLAIPCITCFFSSLHPFLPILIQVPLIPLQITSGLLSPFPLLPPPWYHFTFQQLWLLHTTCTQIWRFGVRNHRWKFHKMHSFGTDLMGVIWNDKKTECQIQKNWDLGGHAFWCSHTSSSPEAQNFLYMAPKWGEAG